VTVTIINSIRLRQTSYIEIYVHKFAYFTIRIRHQLVVRATIQDNTAAQVNKVIEILEKRDAVGDKNARFGCEQALRSDNMIYSHKIVIERSQ